MKELEVPNLPDEDIFEGIELKLLTKDWRDVTFGASKYAIESFAVICYKDLEEPQRHIASKLGAIKWLMERDCPIDLAYCMIDAAEEEYKNV